MVDEKLKIFGNSGLSFSSNELGENISRTAFESSKEQLKLFDFFNKEHSKDGNEVLSKSEINKMLKDLFDAAGPDKIFTPVEIRNYLLKLNLGNDVNVDDFMYFLNTMAGEAKALKIANDVKGAGTKSTITADVNDIEQADVTTVIRNYKKNNNQTIFQAIANELGMRGNKREALINRIRDMIISRARQIGINYNNFKTNFDKEVSKLNMTYGFEANTKNLDKIVEDFIKTMEKPEKLYNENKYGIAQMMADPKLCWHYKDDNEHDKNIMINKILMYANLNNPKESIKKLANNKDEDPKVRQAANALLKSNYLDYFPIYVASIIAQESQFRTDEERVFSIAGKGLMQITNIIAKDISLRTDSAFNKKFIDRLTLTTGIPLNDKTRDKTKIDRDSVSLYKEIINRKSYDVNLDVGCATLASKLNLVFSNIRNNKYDSDIDTTNPSTLIELMSMHYNGNSAPKIDRENNNTPSQVRYLYAHNVLGYFKNKSPETLKVVKGHYFKAKPKPKIKVKSKSQTKSVKNTRVRASKLNKSVNRAKISKTSTAQQTKKTNKKK